MCKAQRRQKPRAAVDVYSDSCAGFVLVFGFLSNAIHIKGFPSPGK